MEGLVKLSFYCFTAASIALAGATVCYLVYAIGRIRVRQATLATSAGTTLTTTSAEFGPGSVGAGRFGTLLAWLVSKKFLAIPCIVLPFLFQHLLQG